MIREPDYEGEVRNAFPNSLAVSRGRNHHAIITTRGTELGIGGTLAHAWKRAWRTAFPTRAFAWDTHEKRIREALSDRFIDAINNQGGAGNPDFDKAFDDILTHGRITNTMAYKHCMIDLETWSTKPNALIISIGAVKFNMDEPISEASPKFHVAITPTTDTMNRFDVSPSTLEWWMAPEREPALRAWQAMEKTDLGSALYAFEAWLWDGQDRQAPAIWGNGATFDNVVLRSAYETSPLLQCPWHYSLDRCYRTMKNLHSKVASPPSDDVVTKFVPGEGRLAHAALFDAVKQAMHLQDIYEHMYD